jgi:hypothetical protein
MEVNVGDRLVIVPDKLIQNYCQKLEISQQEAIEMYLDDEGYTENEIQVALDNKAKKSGVAKKMVQASSEKAKGKRGVKERKPDPAKEHIISELAIFLKEFATDVQVVNIGKIITFSLGIDKYKLDLSRTREKKK